MAPEPVRASLPSDSTAVADGPHATHATLPVAATRGDAAGSVRPSLTDSAEPALRIIAEPATLRVWSNTRVRLTVTQAAGLPQFDRLVWHFEDGSDPVAGAAVEHTFAESVRDRHVTVEAFVGAGPAQVFSKTLPVERLEQASLEGDSAPVAQGSPQRRGTRILFIAAPTTQAARNACVATATASQASAVVVIAVAADLAALDAQLRDQLPHAAVLHWHADEAGDAAQIVPVLEVVRDTDQRLIDVRVGDRPTGVWAIDDVALVPLDTRAEVVSEPMLTAARIALQAAAAYPTAFALSPRPLTPLRDGELIADRAYRLYEYALRHQVSAVVSSTSGVFYDGHFGALVAAAIGVASQAGCARLLDADNCQPPSVTILEAGERRRVKVLHLLGPLLDRLAQSEDLPSEVGKVRR